MFATFVDTALLNGGLNQIIFWDLFFGFCCWFLVYLKSTLNPLFFRASSYSHFAVLKISSLDEFFYSLLVGIRNLLSQIKWNVQKICFFEISFNLKAKTNIFKYFDDVFPNFVSLLLPVKIS